MVRKPHRSHGNDAALRADALPPGAVANLAHELRTPIQVLLGCVDMLREESGARSGKSAIIERMNCNLHDLAGTIENVMEFARESIGDEAAIEENFTVAELFEEIAPMLEAANRGNKLAIRIDLEAAPAMIRTHRRAMHSIIANLAGNAIKFTPTGSVRITMERTRLHGSDAVRLMVKDSGPGIPRELIERAFQPMVQLSDSNTRQHRGLGLGLAIVRHNVRALGGWINFSSEPGHGSVVTVVIPCVVPHAT